MIYQKSKMVTVGRNVIVRIDFLKLLKLIVKCAAFQW